MIRGIDPGVIEREQRLQRLQRPRRAWTDEPVAGELPGREVPRVELRERPYVKRHPLGRLHAADDLAVTDGVSPGVLLDDVVRDFEDQWPVCTTVERLQRALDVHEAEHELRFYLRLDVRASQVGMEEFAARYAVFDLEDQRVLGGQERDQAPPRPQRAPHELLDRERAMRLAVLLPSGHPVEDVSLQAPLSFVDGGLPTFAGQNVAPPPHAPAHAARMSRRLAFE